MLTPGTHALWASPPPGPVFLVLLPLVRQPRKLGMLVGGELMLISPSGSPPSDW